MAEPLIIVADRWHGDLAYLREIPAAERERWRLAPANMSYPEAHVWARDVIRADKVIAISTGETLIRLPEAKASPWSLK
jgi:hypothetical protein